MSRLKDTTHNIETEWRATIQTRRNGDIRWLHPVGGEYSDSEVPDVWRYLNDFHESVVYTTEEILKGKIPGTIPDTFKVFLIETRTEKREFELTTDDIKKWSNSREQRLIDAMFEIAMRTYDSNGRVAIKDRNEELFLFETREDYAKWIASQLNALGFEGGPVGCSWFVLKD